MGKLSVVVGGQFGSEAKGHVAAYLAGREHAAGRRSVGMRVAGPNAGHTVVDAQGQEWKLRTVPVAAVTDPDASLMLAAGSEIDIKVLYDEARALDEAGYNVSGRLLIDSAATLLTAGHVEAERGMHERMGSTGKGIGAARAARIMRTAQTYGDGVGVAGVDTAEIARQALAAGMHLVIEGTQGYGLGLHTRYYPTCTSSDCRAIDFLSMAGISPWDDAITEFDVWVVLRTRPIRVAGPSGELKGETTWEQLGLPAERTTVTNKIRRVGEWDPQLAREAIAANGKSRVRVCLTMVDQVIPIIKGARSWGDLIEEDQQALNEYLAQIEDQIDHPIDLVGTGPNTMIATV